MGSTLEECGEILPHSCGQDPKSEDGPSAYQVARGVRTGGVVHLYSYQEAGYVDHKVWKENDSEPVGLLIGYEVSSSRACGSI